MGCGIQNLQNQMQIVEICLWTQIYTTQWWIICLYWITHLALMLMVDFALLEAIDAVDIIERAGRMFDNEIGDKKNAVQFTCDFLHIPTTSYVLGVCGVDDFNKRFWVTTSVLCHTERGETAERIIGRQVDLINADIRVRKDKALIDGANASKSMWAKVKVKGRGCFTHTTQLAQQRGKKTRFGRIYL